MYVECCVQHVFAEARSLLCRKTQLTRIVAIINGINTMTKVVCAEKNFLQSAHSLRSRALFGVSSAERQSKGELSRLRMKEI